MPKQITLEEALSLVSFIRDRNDNWQVSCVHTNVCNNVYGTVGYDVYGNVGGSVHGIVVGTIDNKKWDFTETPREKLKRLVEEDASKYELLEAIHQLEDN